MRYMCQICGWIYDERLGNVDLDIEAGTSFDELPEDFECPECYATKEAFSEIEE